MNPFFGLMMNMGMGCMPSPFMMGMNFMMPSLFCGCSNFMTMPYYQNDNLGFLNFPVYRDTSADFLLDPNLALKQCQMNWQNGGGFGRTLLPGFSFPQIPPLGGYPIASGTAQSTQQKTDAEKEAEKQQQAVAESPAGKKAQKLYEVFNKVKKFAEDNTNLFPEITEELSKKAEEAIKKGTGEERLTAMKEVMAVVPADVLRKTALADDKVRILLRKAGYNFNLLQNKYSLKNEDIKKDDIDHIDRLRQLHSDIQEKKFNELALITGILSHTDEAKAKILGIISSWNDRFNSENERGIIRYIAANLPLGALEEAKLSAVRESTKIFVLAILAKADEFEGYDKITAARDKVSEQFDIVFGKNINGTDGKFNKSNLDKLAELCDALYVRMRMQEAVATNEYVKRNFSFLNEVKEGIINEKTIIEETQKDLKLEGLTPVEVSGLDKPPVSQELLVQQQVEMRELDNQYDGDGQAIIDALVAQGELKKVDGQENIYQAKFINGYDNLTGYYIVKDNKIYPVRKVVTVTTPAEGDPVETVEYKELKNASELTAEQIGSTNLVVERVNNLIEKNALKILPALSSTTRQFFKSTGKTNDKHDYYVLQNGKLYHIINVKEVKREDPNDRRSKWIVTFEDGRKTEIKDIAETDLEEFEDNEIKTAEQTREEDNAKLRQDVDLVEAHRYSCLKDISESNEEMDKISKEITATPENPEGQAGQFRKVPDMNGYFESLLPYRRLYKYDLKTQSLKYLDTIKTFYTNYGIVEDADGKTHQMAEIFTEYQLPSKELIESGNLEVLSKVTDDIRAYGLSFAQIINPGGTPSEKFPEECRKLNTIIAMDDPFYTINFIKGYRSDGTEGMFEKIFDEADPDFPVANDTIDSIIKFNMDEKFPNEYSVTFDQRKEYSTTVNNYVWQFAKLLLKVADTTGMDRSSEEYKDLEKMAKGMYAHHFRRGAISIRAKKEYTGIEGAAMRLDEITTKVIEAYDKKYS